MLLVSKEWQGIKSPSKVHGCVCVCGGGGGGGGGVCVCGGGGGGGGEPDFG